MHNPLAHFSFSAFQLLPDRFDVGVDADDHGHAVDAGFGGFVSVAAGNRERLAGRGLCSGISMWRTLSLMVVFMVFELSVVG